MQERRKIILGVELPNKLRCKPFHLLQLSKPIPLNINLMNYNLTNITIVQYITDKIQLQTSTTVETSYHNKTSSYVID